MGLFWTNDSKEAEEKIREIQSKLANGLDPDRVDTPEEGDQVVFNIQRTIREKADSRW